jgi:hypothetical protein
MGVHVGTSRIDGCPLRRRRGNWRVHRRREPLIKLIQLAAAATAG